MWSASELESYLGWVEESLLPLAIHDAYGGHRAGASYLLEHANYLDRGLREAERRVGQSWTLEDGEAQQKRILTVRARVWLAIANAFPDSYAPSTAELQRGSVAVTLLRSLQRTAQDVARASTGQDGEARIFARLNERLAEVQATLVKHVERDTQRFMQDVRSALAAAGPPELQRAVEDTLARVARAEGDALAEPSPDGLAVGATLAGRHLTHALVQTIRAEYESTADVLSAATRAELEVLSEQLTLQAAVLGLLDVQHSLHQFERALQTQTGIFRAADYASVYRSAGERDQESASDSPYHRVNAQTARYARKLVDTVRGAGLWNDVTLALSTLEAAGAAEIAWTVEAAQALLTALDPSVDGDTEMARSRLSKALARLEETAWCPGWLQGNPTASAALEDLRATLAGLLERSASEAAQAFTKEDVLVGRREIQRLRNTLVAAAEESQARPSS